MNEERIAAIADGARQVAALDDPVGELIEQRELANGLRLRKLRVPLGVVAVVYEARPNVTIDASALCLKAGNACLLRGSGSAEHSNSMMVEIAADAAESVGLPRAVITLVGGGRDQLAELATQQGVIDLIVPRGGEGLKAALEKVATIPVLYAASGNCHVYVDRAADLEQAAAIAVNAKVQRPGVCNAAETLLIHREVAAEFAGKIHACRARNRHLRGSVDRKIRRQLADQFADTHVLHNGGIHPGGNDGAEVVFCIRDLILKH